MTGCDDFGLIKFSDGLKLVLQVRAVVCIY